MDNSAAEADALLGAGAPEEVAGEPMLSNTDTILIGLFIATVLWFLFRNSRDSDDGSPPANIHINSSPILPRSDRTDEGTIVSKMLKSGSKVVVFYGSQTGTAEEMASRLAKEAHRYGLKSMVADPEEYDMAELSQVPVELKDDHLAIFCMATYGEGDPTDNAAEFHQMLLDQQPDFTDLNYCVFALGNSTYEHYNSTGRYINKRLEELGGNCILPLGEGDDDSTMDNDIIEWKEQLWPKVCSLFGVDSSDQDINMRQYNLDEPEDPDREKLFVGEVTRLKSYLPERQKPPFEPKNPFMSRLLANRELHKGGDRNCLHIEFDIANSKMRYDAGDHVALYPCNEQRLVEELCTMLGKDTETVFRLTAIDSYASKKSPFPCPTTYRTALSYYVDITSCPKMHVLKEFLPYTASEEDKAKLELMTKTTVEGKAAYQEYVIQNCRTVNHILEDLPSCRPPLDYLLELLPRLQVRYYSISSSSKAHPTSVHVTAVVLKYETPTKRTNKGVATNWLMHQMPSEEQEYKVPLYIRKSQFRLPIKSEVPIIMIGPGTGLAPYRGFLQERQVAADKGASVGKTVLYFGCRRKAEDYLYQEELEQYEASGLLTLRVAFSRDQGKKVYVQHLLLEDAQSIWEIIGKQKGHLYVCGDAKSMAREVNATIVGICRDHGEKTQQQAEDFVKNMISMKKYSSDVWS